MFEGFVSQVLLGYLGRYIKGIQKDQLKIGLWREEVLLENVELILEAFDYLQLPFALKTGKVGKLSIKVPWKKLGWEPIIVALEDVFICACQREDNEWSSDSVEKRELAGKMAKLNTIELAKFSRRVSDNPAGQSFLSYIYAKIIDNIQVSIKNVHIIYIDSHNDKGNFIFGLRFSNLTIMTDSQKQNATLSTIGKSRSSQVNKSVEMSDIGLYCNLLEGNPDPLRINGTTSSQLFCDVDFQSERYDYLVTPFDVSISLLVNKTRKLDGAPQYAIIAELTTLVVSLNDIQLEQIPSLLDYFSVSALRERYGRYRPPQYSLSQKLRGWQIMWWQYAQKSVLADVRQKLRTSWSNFGKRISQCRRYVRLYKRKLELLQNEQLVNKDILMELEKMDKECEIDDILNFRGIAEYELQELVNSNASNIATDEYIHSQEKQQSTDQSTNRERGWINWLSLGMLGAGGTADSSSFAGVVSDEIIKDIYDATEFHPAPSSGGDSSNWDKFCSFSVKIKILQIVSTFSSWRLKRNIAKSILDGIDVESKVWEDSVSIFSMVGSVKIINPCDNVTMLLPKKAIVEENFLENVSPFIDIQVILQPNQSSELALKVTFQPFEVTLESEFYLDLLNFCHVLTSFEFQYDRVLCSLNRVTSCKARLLSKIEYISFNRKKINWDVSLENVVIKLPLKSEVSDKPFMALELGGLSFTSRTRTENDRQVLDNNCSYDIMCKEYLKQDHIDDVPLNIQLRDLYDYYTIKLTGFEVYMSMCTKPGATSVIEKFNASIGIRLCIFFDEPMLKALEVDCVLPSVSMKFSPVILYALAGAREKLLQQNYEDVAGGVSDHNDLIEPVNFQFSVSVKSEQLSLSIDLEEDDLQSSVISFTLMYIDFRYTMQEYPECYFFVKFLKAKELNGESSSCVLCSSRNDSGSFAPRAHAEKVGLNSQSVTQTEDSSEEGCFKFKYHSQIDGSIVQHKCRLILNDVDLHIYPRIFGLLNGLSDKLNKQSDSSANPLELNQHREDTETVGVGFSKSGFHNFYDTEPSTTASTPVQFPFVTIYNSGSLGNLEGSLVCGFPEMQSCNLNYRHPEIQTFKFRRKHRTVDCSTAQSPCGTGTINMQKHSNTISMLLLDVNLNSLRAHFHDSSCILGTITLPKSKSSFLSQGNVCWDAQISTEGLLLSSSWSPPNIHDQLWGPASPSTSPILNIRIRTQKTCTLVSMTEISFGIQHVYCVLPSSYLAMVIGYFSLPDWSTKGSKCVNNQTSCENKEFGNVPNKQSDLLYKIEILHSRLILPVESQTDFCLQLGLSQLYFSFLPERSGVDANVGIPLCCVIPTNPIADQLDIINIFGRSISLSLISLRNDADFLLKQDQCSPIANVPLIEQLDADMWIRIPCITRTYAEQSDAPTLIMIKEYVCNFIAQDMYAVLGFQAIDRIVDELSNVGEESKLFSCDVLQFLQARKSLKVANAVTLDGSNSSCVSMKICAKAVSIKFYHLWMEQTISSEAVAKLDFQLNVSASFKMGILKSLDVDIPGLVLHSIPSNLPLASFVSDTMASHLCINFYQPEVGGKELLFSIPILDVWLHLSEVNNFIDVLWSCNKGNSTSASSGHESMCDDVPESQFAHNFASECMAEDVILIVKCENSAIAVHFPIFGEDLANSETDDSPKYWKYVKFVIHNRYAEVTVAKKFMILKCNMEKMRAILETIHGQNISSIPFMQFSQIKLESKAVKRGELIHAVVDVQIESLDVGLSYQIFSFLSQNHFKFSERSSTLLPCHCMVYHVHLRKGSVLMSDGRGSYHGPIFEILTKSMLVEFKQTQDVSEGTTNADIIINYNNIDKVMWEPFVEPCSIRLNIVQKIAGTVLLNPSATTDIVLESTEHLNLNITEPLVEAIFRIKRMVNDALKQREAGGLQENDKISELHSTDDVHTRRYAPYILQNDTSLPLTFHVSRGSISTDDICGFLKNHGNIVQPGHTVPIYVEETVDEQHFRHRTAYSSERLIEKKINTVAHHMISIHLEGTTNPSKPMSMDLVGLSYFEVNFSNNKLSDTIEIEREADFSGLNRMTEKFRSDQNKGLVVPVVFEVSMQHYSKMIRLYSTVILFNATSMPLELRFDIPFGFSPKVLDPILPGQEIPMPLHLAESGRIRWRPLGNNYLWSEAHSLSNILSQEYRLGFLRSFVCYPAHPTSDPFRCCISIQDYSVSASGGARKVPSLGGHVIRRDAVNSTSQSLLDHVLPKKHLIRQVRFTTPFSVKNYLPIGVSLMIESGGVPHSIYVKEVDVASIFLVDSTNDLGITFQMKGYKPIVAKFPRAESFSSIAKLNGSKCYLSETLSLYPETTSGPIYVTLEKAMDASSGAREICVYVSFLLYNCTGLVLTIVDGEHERRGIAQVIPSSYNLIGDEHLLYGKQGLPFLSPEIESFAGVLDVNSHTISTREKTSFHLHKLSTKHFPYPFTYSHFADIIHNKHPDARGDSLSSLGNSCLTNEKLHRLGNNENGNENMHIGSNVSEKVKPYMYCPLQHTPGSELRVKLSAHMPQSISGNALYSAWSSLFPLVPASGSANVVIPKPNDSGAFLISATSIPIAGELSGRTRAITFQPRYVICNACNRELRYKQKGTNDFYLLGVGQHSHLHLSDTSRELYVSVQFNEPGWEWSGSFLPDCLGDVQVKMRNYVSGTLHMVRVEVQNADFAIRDRRMIKNANSNSSTWLILLSDDDSGFMPYRIDNFSMERLRIYQQRCEFFETIVHAYSSANYSWDEPCYPHRLVVEVPGERILGTYTLDSVHEYLPVHLSSTAEKAERRLYISVHAEGAIKVLSIIDSSCHITKDMKEMGLLGLKEKKIDDHKQGAHAEFNEVLTVHLPFIGISFINSSPQELVFVCARGSIIKLMQSLDEQKLSFQTLALQIDNQLSDTQYPIMLSFDNEHRGKSTAFLKNKGHALRMQKENLSPTSSESTNDSVIYFAASKWRNADTSLVSFKYINLRLAPLCIELEEQVLLSLFDFLRTVFSRLHSTDLQKNFEMRTVSFGIGAVGHETANHQCHKNRSYNLPGVSKNSDTNTNKGLLPSVIPIGTPWQQIKLSGGRQKKIYIEVFEMAPIKLSLSFTSTPWMIRNEAQPGVENLSHIGSTTFQRSLIALVDVEGVPVHLRELTFGHLMANRESVEEIITKHYTRQLIHEMYKVFGSAGVIGNPIGFARNVGLGIRDFLSVSSREIVQSPIGLLNGVAQGSKSLLSNTVYAISSATSQFTKTAHKGIVAFTFDEQAVAEMDAQLKGLEPHGRGILSEFLEGLTGLLQSPIRGAEKHGLPGVLSGIAMGTAGLVARPMASILEAIGKTAHSIRKRSSPHQSNCRRIRFPRPLARELPLLPYSWEEAIGVAMLVQADGSRFRDETFVMCKALKQPGKFVIISRRLVFSVWCPCLVDLGSPEFDGVPADPEWVIETDMSLESIVHIDRADDAVNIVGSNAETASRQRKGSVRDNTSWKSPTSAPLYYMRVEFRSPEEAEDVLQVLLSTIDQGKERRWGSHVLHRSNLR